ncbi:hypothetical protein LIER_29097 [Lithospermum erythrorhizon]|uniref:Uncharacterized protein n=1 Tax=Lithospermum erythrorhizon TaxID=34254 RepID=A0AAV3RJ20_LITER
MPRKVKLVDEMGKEVFQEVEYEWLPFKCRTWYCHVGYVVDNHESLVVASSPGPLREEGGDVQVPLSAQEEAKGLGSTGGRAGQVPLFSSKQSLISVEVVEDRQRSRDEEFPNHDVEVSCIDRDMFPKDEKKELWRSLAQNSKVIDCEPWLVFGEFNVIRELHEASGGYNPDIGSMGEFNYCIDDVEIMDLPGHGCSFTWSKGTLLRKLDRVMCNNA